MENSNNKIQEEIIGIKGMHCKSCVSLIEFKLSSLQGVKEIKVNLLENKAFVRFDQNEISLGKIKSEIEALGYSTASIKEINIKKTTLLQGLFYGLIPHIGCIAFIIGSILGVTFLMKFFKPLLMNRYFFHILILISLAFATLSSLFYLRKNGFLSLAGIKRKWKYLSIMYGSTIGINLLLFFVIFPLLANVSLASPSVTGAVIGLDNSLSSLKLKVDIPCPGHAPLISNELKSINGLIEVKFSFPNIFDVKYDPAKTSKQEILSLEVFKTYKASVLDSSAKQAKQANQYSSVGSGGSGSCGGTGGGCSCGG